MQHVLIIGAHGQVGQLLTRKLKDSPDYTPVALIRKEEQRSQFQQLGVEARVASLEASIDELAGHLQGVDAVVFAAGSGGSTGPDKTLTVDLDGAVKAMEAAAQAGVKRFVMLSALHTDDRDVWEKLDDMKPYYVAKYYADRILKTTDLDWTIVRPGTLTDESGTGKIDTSDPDAHENVPRADVAAVILEVLGNEGTIGRIISFNRGDTPIAEAVANG